ncbi:xylulokinase [Roseicyclus mahoneyensis]|uniref:Xylulose kinase n=1 Tax=Roseicyclus mahoneyensis TaxID=164332 RepID=A0A316GG80_9RHOB|nr:xylulokinase [Roseicyclus mahoneyensis]PWK59970.1 xylulokinase [Roseicyclus mahoneyensis]
MFLGIDLGTSGAKLLVTDDRQSVVAEAHAPVASRKLPAPWSEQDPQDWIAAIEQALSQIVGAHPGLLGQVRGIGLSGHMHGAVLLDAADNVLRPCIMWNDGRAAQECADLTARADFEGVGGNLVMAGFTAPKLLWVQRHEPEMFRKISCVLLPKDYVRLWLTGDHVAEMSDAAGTLWLDVGGRAWSPALLEATGLTEAQMPRLVEGTEASSRLRAELCRSWGFAPDTIVAGGAGDNAAAACGMGIVEDGAFVSLGTSGVVFAPTKTFRPNTKQGVHSFCHAVPGTWHQMGVILAAASCLDWLARIMGRDVAAMLTLLPERIDGPSPVRFLPYLTGVRTPHNDPMAQASFHGMTAQTDGADLVQAVLEGVGFALKDCVDALAAAGTTIDQAYAVGGGSRARIWLQIIADICDVTLLIPERGEYGAAFGAARLAQAAVAGGYDPSLFGKPAVAQVIQPDAGRSAAYAEAHRQWRRLYADA